MGGKYILRFRRIEFEIVRRKPERDLVKVKIRLENLHVRRRVNGFENENVIGTNDIFSKLVHTPLAEISSLVSSCELVMVPAWNSLTIYL